MNTQTVTLVQEEIEDQEEALKELLLRVMEPPLKPVLEKIELLEEQVEAIGKQCNDTIAVPISGLTRTLEEQKRATRANFDRLPDQFREVVEELVSARLAEISQGISRVNDSQKQGAESLGLTLRSLQEDFKGADENFALLQSCLKQDGDRVVRELQLGGARAESLATVLAQFRNEHAVVSQAWAQSQKERGGWEKDQSMVLKRYGQSIENVQACLTDLQSDAKAVVEITGEVLGKLVEGFSSTGLALELQKIQSVQSSARSADELRRSGERIDALAPQVSEKVDKFGGAVQTRLQQMQRRIVLLSVVSGLSLGGTVALLIKMLV